MKKVISIIYELTDGTGKVREYYKDDLLYDGEYLNGMKNGKGKDYDYITQKLSFKGEFLKGKRWNGEGYDNDNIQYVMKKGKGLYHKYDSKGKLIYNIEYSSLKKNGEIKEYNENCELKFEGR